MRGSFSYLKIPAFSGASDVKKLIEAGYNTIESVAYAPKKALLAIKGNCFDICTTFLKPRNHLSARRGNCQITYLNKCGLSFNSPK